MLSSRSGKCTWFIGDMSVSASEKLCWLSVVFHHLLFASIPQVNKTWFQILNSINVMASVKWEGHPFSVPPCYIQGSVRWDKSLFHSWNPILCMYLCFSLMQFSKYDRVITFGLQIMKVYFSPSQILLLQFCGGWASLPPISGKECCLAHFPICNFDQYHSHIEVPFQGFF